MFPELEKFKKLAQDSADKLDAIERKLDAIIRAQIVFADANAAKGTPHKKAFEDAAKDLVEVLS